MLKRILLAIAFFLLPLLVAEPLVRIAFPHWAPRTPRLSTFWRFDEAYGWSHVPGARGRFESFGFDVFVEINSQGFRGPEIAFPKDEEKLRVLVVGDSLVWGFGVEQPELFTSKLQAKCPGLEVINFAVSGYSTDQELLLFRERGSELRPDVVVLVVAVNDFPGNIRTTEYVYYHKPVFVLESEGLVLVNRPVPRASPFIRTAAWIARHSFLLTQLGRLVQSVTSSRPTAQAPDPPSARSEAGPSSPFPRNKAEHLTAKLIAQFFEEVRAVGARGVLVFSDRHGPRARALAEHVDLPDVPVVFLDDAMAPDEFEKLHLPEDIHWSDAGHTVVAGELLESLRVNGVVERARCRGD